MGVALSAGPRPLNPRWFDPSEHDAAARQELAEDRYAREQVRDLELASIGDAARRRIRAENIALSERSVRAEEDRRLDELRRRLSDERRARYSNWPRARILILADLVITGPTRNGVGLQSFLRQEDVVSGGRSSLQPRLGLESEPVVNRLITRVGTYIEATRYRRDTGRGILSSSRQHFTFGLEVRTFAWDLLGLIHRTDFTVKLVGDLAPRYQNFGLSFGTWH